jgi:hypothetical protein
MKRLYMIENMVLMKVFDPKWEEVTIVLRWLHNFLPFIVDHRAGQLKQKEMCNAYFKNVICL